MDISADVRSAVEDRAGQPSSSTCLIRLPASRSTSTRTPQSLATWSPRSSAWSTTAGRGSTSSPARRTHRPTSAPPSSARACSSRSARTARWRSGRGRGSSSASSTGRVTAPSTSAFSRMIEVEGLTKKYGSTVAVDDLSFSVSPGPSPGSSDRTARASPRRCAQFSGWSGRLPGRRPCSACSTASSTGPCAGSAPCSRRSTPIPAGRVGTTSASWPSPEASRDRGWTRCCRWSTCVRRVDAA